jgi:hypothetical protein
MKLNKDDRREEMAALGTIIIITVISIALIIQLIFRVWN